MTPKDPYEVLGVAKDASEGDVQKAYQKLAMQYHPDKHLGAESAAVRLKEITEAYETLKSDFESAAYKRINKYGFTATEAATDAVANPQTNGAETPKEEALLPRYPGMNTRMIASTIDMLILIVLTETPIQKIGEYFWPPLNIPMPTVAGIEGMPAGLAELQQLGAASQNPEYILQSLLNPQSILMNVTQIGLLALLSIVGWARFGATPGMYIFRMRIKDAATNEKISYVAASIRFLGYFVSMLPLGLGFLWMFFNKKKQGWHDIMAHSVVVLPPSKKRKWFLG